MGANQQDIGQQNVKNYRRRIFRIPVLLSVLSFIFFVFGSIAFFQRNMALQQASTAQAASTSAMIQREAAIAFAVAQQETAQAKEREMQLQVSVSRANELAAQSISLREKNFLVSMLLGIEAYKKSDTFYSKGVLLDNVRANPQLQVYLSGYTNEVRSAAFSPDGAILAAGGFDNTVLLWDAKTGQRIGLPLVGPQLGEGYTSFITSLAFSPDGKILAAGSFDTTIILWDVKTGKLIGSPLTAHKYSIAGVVFSPDGNTLVSTTCDNPPHCYRANDEAILWDVKNRQPIEKIKSSSITAAFRPDGNILALAGDERNTIILWDLKEHRVSKKLSTEQPVYKLIYFPDGRLASILVSDKYSLVLWNLGTEHPINSEPFDIGSTSFVFSPDGNALIGEYGSDIVQTDIKTHQSSFFARLWNLYGLDILALSPDGNTVAVVDRDKKTVVLLNKAESDGPLSKLLVRQYPKEQWLNNQYIRHLAFSPDGKSLFSDNALETIRWDVKSGQPMEINSFEYEFKENSGLVESSFDGSLRILRDPNGITLLDVKTNKVIIKLQTWNTRPAIMEFSPDGKTLAFIRNYADLVLWDVNTRQQFGEPLLGQMIAFDPDGDVLATAYSERIILWDINPQSWIDKTCQRVGRNFTYLEWAKYFPDEEYRATCPQWPLQPDFTITQ